MESTLRRSAVGVLPAMTLFAVSRLGSAAEVFPVDVSSDKFTLYTDPNSGATIRLGGFSGLVPAWGTSNGKLFHVITDRGPTVDGPTGGKAFPAPDFTPSIITVHLKANGTGQILKVLPLRKPGGNPITGLPNECSTNEDPVIDLSGNLLAHDPDGQDVEGLTPGPGGTFWICEEYLPSVSLVNSDGTVSLRLVPKGATCGGEAVPTVELLPPVLRKRRANRGFEGITLTTGGRLYATVQRPLNNPTQAVGNASRNIRIVEIDVEKALNGESSAVRQLLYLTESPANSNILLSDLYALSDDVVLVSERRTDKVFAMHMSSASDITGLEDANGNLLVPYQPDPLTPAKTTIEQLTEAELAAIGVTTLSKTEVYSNLRAVDPALDKVEGIALVGSTLFVCPDNDFDLTGVGDFTTTPGAPIFQSPANPPKIFSIPIAPISLERSNAGKHPGAGRHTR